MKKKFKDWLPSNVDILNATEMTRMVKFMLFDFVAVGKKKDN